MKDIIEFPQNFEGHLRLGKEALAENNLLEAIEHFREAYNLEDDENANLFLATSLAKNSQFREAQKIAEEKLSYYIQNADRLTTYIRMLLGNKLVIKARMMWQRYLAKEDNYQELADEITQMENFLTQYQSAEIMQLKKELENTVPQGYQLTSYLQNLYKLPVGIFIELTNKILRKNCYPLLLRSILLENMVTLNVSVEVEISDVFGESWQVKPSELKLFAEQDVYKEVLSLYKQHVSSETEEHQQMLMQEQVMYLKLLYPVAEFYIKNAENWVQASLSPYEEIFTITSTEKSKLLEIEAEKKMLNILKEQLS